MGKCWYDFLPPFIHEKVIENINKLTIENPINRYNQMVLNGNGSYCWLACTDIAVFDDSGSILEIQSVGKDITEQVKLETELKVSKQKAEAILKAIPDLMFVYDIDGKILECYASDTSQLLAPVEVMISKNLRDFLPDDLTLEAYEKIKICIETDTEQTIDYSLTINGSKQYYEAKFVKFEDDKVLSISRNITRKKQTEEKLVQSEEMYRKLVNTLPDAVVIVTLDHRILFASPKALQLFGCSDPSEYLGTQAGDWIVDEYISLASEIVGNLEQGKENMFTQVSLKRKDGSTFIGDVNAGTVSNREGKIWGFLLVIRDVTIRKQFEDQIRLLYTAVEQSPVSVIITDISGKIEYVNSNFAINTGYSESEVIGKNPSILKSGLQSKEVYEHLWIEISQGRDWKGELINKRKDGTLFWEAVSISPVKNFDGSITNYLAVKEDITERKRVEQELIDAKNKAEESDRLKTAFLANISHEIRTPMNGIVGFASLLNDPSLPHEKIQEYTTIIQNGCNRLLSIITDMVDISKIEAGIMQTNKSTVERIKASISASGQVKGYRYTSLSR